MNGLSDLDPNTTHMNQKPTNPFGPGDRVVRADDSDASVSVVVDVPPPEKEVGVYGHGIDGEAVRVAFPSSLDEGPGDWREIHPALLSSYCDDQSIQLYDFNHTNLEFAENLFTPGDHVLKRSHDDPDTAVVVERLSDGEVKVVYEGQLDGDEIYPQDLSDHCESQEISTYSYNCDELVLVESY
jgi:hypothetical protein